MGCKTAPGWGRVEIPKEGSLSVSIHIFYPFSYIIMLFFGAGGLNTCVCGGGGGGGG